MKRLSPTKPHPRRRDWFELDHGVAPFAFFLLTISYVGLRIRPELDYQAAAATFRQLLSQSNHFPAHPGGVFDRAAALIAVMDYHNWVGTLIFAGLVGLACLIAQRFISRMGGERTRLAALVAPFILLLLRDSQNQHAIEISLGWLAGVGTALGYANLAVLNPWKRQAFGWILSTLLFGVAGFWPCILFATLGGLVELNRRAHWKWALGCVMGGLAIPLLLIYCLAAEPTEILNPWGTGRQFGLVTALYLVIPLASVGAIWRARDAENGREAATTTTRDRARLHLNGVPWWLAASCFIFGWVVVWYSHSAFSRELMSIDYHAYRGDQEQVLAAAKRAEELPTAEEISLYRALFHTGGLSRELFSFRKQCKGNLLPGLGGGLRACRAQAETLLELGQVNLAEHFFHEALEQEGDRPDILRELARINVLKDRPQAARVFLKALSQIPFQRVWAHGFLSDLEMDEKAANHPDLRQIRARGVNTDLPHLHAPTDVFLRQLLHANRGNRMAFEYLMADFLLNCQPEKIWEEISRLDDFDYSGIPRLYEEALLLHQQQKGINQLELQGREISADTIERFRRFRDRYERGIGGGTSKRETLVAEFGDTFWFYYYFGPTTGAAEARLDSVESL
jgi:hypothetical protein